MVHVDDFNLWKEEEEVSIKLRCRGCWVIGLFSVGVAPTGWTVFIITIIVPLPLTAL